MSDSPIFIVGTPRSGTTLTAQILDRHPRIMMPGENHFFEDIYARRKELGDPTDPAAKERIIQRLLTIYGRYNQPADQERVDALLEEHDLFPQLNSGTSSYKDILDRFMEIQLKQAKKTRWGNNAPKDLFHVEEILAFYPEAKFLICVRDVRDFLLSYKDRWKVTTQAHKDRLKRLYHPVLTSLLWKASMKRIPKLEQQIPRKNLMIVRYEDLVTDTEQVVRNICEVVGEDFLPEMLNVQTHNSSDGAGRKGIFSSSIGKWRDKLPAEEAAIAQWIGGNELMYLGYRLESIEINRMVMAKAIVQFPAAAVRAFKANAANRGPLLQYLSKRLTAMLG